jgi:chromosome segregation ATPase
MPLTPKDEISEAPVEQQANQSGGEALAELRDRVGKLEERTEVPLGLESLDQLHDAHQSHTQAIDENVGELEDRVEELEERVDRHENVLSDLLRVVEYITANMGDRKMKNGKAIVENESSDAVPVEWNDDVWRFKSERFE